jgi:hypothetical protein
LLAFKVLLQHKESLFMPTRNLASVLAAILAGTLAFFPATTAVAGPIAEYEATFRSAYADYRNALFATNTKNREGSEKTIAAFDAKWSALTVKYRTTPPQHYAEDAKWPESLQTVTGIVARARAEIGKGALAEAHETLESARDVFAALRERNGVIAYSDRIDAFHHAMEEVLTKAYGGFAGEGLIELIEDASVLAYLSAELRKSPPPEATNSAEFALLLSAVNKAVAELRAAARAGDAEQIKAGRSKIKPAFAKLFVKFG